jgi:hypothetical protein
MNHASPFQWPENEREQRTAATSGLKCSVLLKKSSPVGLLVKMCLASTAWKSNIATLTWKAIPIAEPQKTQTWTQQGLFGQSSKTSIKSVTIAKSYVYRLVPRVHGTDGTGSGLLPTPAARDWKGAGTRNENTVPNVIEGRERIGTKTGLKLQPGFVEWMMGYPQNWTDLNCLKPATELLGLKD